MDGTRDSDLNVLHAVLHDPSETIAHKRQANRAMSSIKRKMRDPKLKALRERLIRAQRASDVGEVEKISDELHEYEQRTYGRG